MCIALIHEFRYLLIVAMPPLSTQQLTLQDAWHVSLQGQNYLEGVTPD